MKDSEKSQKIMNNGCINKALDSISSSNRMLYSSMEKNDRELFLETFRGLKLSTQTQREFLVWLPEIAQREDKSIEMVLESAGLREILNDTRTNAPQKISKTRETLHKTRYPLLDKAEKNWKKYSRKINPDPSSVTFSHDDYFEKERLNIKVMISDSGKAKELFRKLADIDEKNWKMLLSPLSNDTINR